MKNDTDIVSPGGKYMREIRRNRARGVARSEARSTSPIDSDLVENPPGEITGRLEAKGRSLQGLR